MASQMLTAVSLAFLSLCLVYPAKNDSPSLPKGHLEKLGSHRKPKGTTMIGKFSRPETFFSQFVEPGVPLLMRGALEVAGHPGLTKWTDGYLRDRFGDEMVNVETSRKENRQGRRTTLSLQQYLNLYLTEDIYLVHSLKGKMSELVLVPESVQCGGFQKVLQEAVLWMGSGESASVLHYDGLDNLLCLLDGHKDVVLIDKDLKPLIESVGFNQEGGYSDLDVNKVDFEKYSHLQNIEWYKASVLKGDCIFIPKGWYHHVRSSGVRHLAVNLWLSHLWWFNMTDCSYTETPKPLKAIQHFGFASPNEYYREKLLELLHAHDFSNRHDLISAITTATKDRAAQFFDAIDEQKDFIISVAELYRFDIDMAVYKFPDIFGLPHNPVAGEEEEDIVLYPVKSETKPEESKATTDQSREEVDTDEEDGDLPETLNVQGSQVRFTKSDDNVEESEETSENGTESRRNIKEEYFFDGWPEDSPDSPMLEEEPLEPEPLLPDDQVVGVAETRGDTEVDSGTRESEGEGEDESDSLNEGIVSFSESDPPSKPKVKEEL